LHGFSYLQDRKIARHLFRKFLFLDELLRLRLLLRLLLLLLLAVT
jgi:hypothetical protein